MPHVIGIADFEAGGTGITHHRHRAVNQRALFGVLQRVIEHVKALLTIRHQGNHAALFEIRRLETDNRRHRALCGDLRTGIDAGIAGRCGVIRQRCLADWRVDRIPRRIDQQIGFFIIAHTVIT